MSGYVRNTEPLSYEKRSSYTLELKAEDCGGRMSDTAVLTVNVRPLCQPGWTGKLSPVELLLELTGRNILIALPVLNGAGENVFRLSVCMSVFASTMSYTPPGGWGDFTKFTALVHLGTLRENLN